MYYLAQVLGFFGLLAMVIALFQKNKSKMLFWIIFNCIFFSLEYLFLGAFTGMGSNIVALGRTYLFKKKDEDKRFDSIWIYIIVMVLYTIIGIVTYDSLISLMPIVAEYIYATALWQKNIEHIRYGTAIMVVVWLIYDIIVQAYHSAICDTIVLTSTLIPIVKFFMV